MTRISIIIPTRNRSSFLERAVTHAYFQNHSDLEVIVSDNNSSDSTPIVLERLQHKFPDLICIRHSHTIPLGLHWHKVVTEYSSGDLILLIPDDDILVDPTYLQQAAVIFDLNPSVGLVFAGHVTIDSRGNTVDICKPPWRGKISGSSLLQNYNKGRHMHVPHLTAIFSRHAFDRVGGFSCDFLSPDMYLWLKIALFYDAYCLRKSVAEYMAHSGSLSRQIDASLQLMDVHMINLIRAQISEEALDPGASKALSRIGRHLYKCFHIAITKQCLYGQSVPIRLLLRVNPWLYLIDLVPDLFQRGFLLLRSNDR